MSEQHLSIIGEFIDNITPALQKLSGQSLPQVQAALAGLAGGLAGGAAVAIVEKLGEVIKDVVLELPKLTLEAIEAADEMGKMAQRAGVAVEEIQNLQLAAALSDVSTKDMTTSLRKLNVEISKAAGDDTSKAALTFKALGIEVKNADGSMISASQALQKIGEKFSESADGANKTTLAMEMGGRGLVNMIPLLNQGQEELNKTIAVQKGMGFNFTPEEIKQSEEFNDALKTIGITLKGVGSVIAKELLPFITETAKYFAEGAKEGGILNDVVHGVGQSFAFLVEFLNPFVIGFATVGAVIKATAQELAGFAAAANALLHMDPAGAKVALAEMEKDVEKTYTDLANFIEKTNKDPKTKAPSIADKKPDNLPNPETLMAAQKLTDEYTKTIAKLNSELVKANKSGKENELIYETTQGTMTKFSPVQKAHIVDLGRQIDIQTNLTNLMKEYNSVLDARTKKEADAHVAKTAAYIEDQTQRAGFVAAETQRIEMESKFAKLREDASKLAAGAKSQALADIAAKQAEFEVGGKQYELAKQSGEQLQKIDAATKVYTDTIGKNQDALANLNVQQQLYDNYLAGGLINLDRYNKLSLDNKRAIEDLAASQTVAGKAFSDIIVSNRRGMDDVVMKMDAIRKANGEGTISTAEYTKAMYDLQQSYDNLNPTYAIDQVQKMKDEIKSTTGAFEGMFSDYLFQGMQGKWQNLGDMVKKIIDKMVANMLAAQIQMALFGDMGSTPSGKTSASTGLIGNLFGSLFGGARASGGDVIGGKAYLVGEKRPEIFVAPSNGKILPNVGDMSSGTTINISAVDAQSFQSLLAKDAKFVGQLVMGAQRRYGLTGV